MSSTAEAPGVVMKLEESMDMDSSSNDQLGTDGQPVTGGQTGGQPQGYTGNSNGSGNGGGATESPFDSLPTGNGGGATGAPFDSLPTTAIASNNGDVNGGQNGGATGAPVNSVANDITNNASGNGSQNVDVTDPSRYSEEPAEPYDPSGRYRNLGPFTTVGWYEHRGVTYFINKYGPRSHAFYRLQLYADNPATQDKPPEDLNILKQAHSKWRNRGETRPLLDKKNWRAIEAVAWFTDFEIFSEKVIAEPEKLVELEVKEIRPENGKNTRLIIVLNVWEDGLDAAGKPNLVYGFEPKSATTRFTPKGEWAAYYAAWKQVYRYQEYCKNNDVGRSVTPQPLLTQNQYQATTQQAFQQKLHNLEVHRRSTSPEAIRQGNDNNQDLDGFVVDDGEPDGQGPNVSSVLNSTQTVPGTTMIPGSQIQWPITAQQNLGAGVSSMQNPSQTFPGTTLVSGNQGPSNGANVPLMWPTTTQPTPSNAGTVQTAGMSPDALANNPVMVTMLTVMQQMCAQMSKLGLEMKNLRRDMNGGVRW
ncbi:hypothetical protein MAJ_06782, partial [Metarhizium majus ARSEF 297]